MKLSTIVRAISPFTRSNKAPQTDPSNKPIVIAEWDLSNVDLRYALKLFYKKYNPEKSFIVADILQKYHGEEQLLLRQLQERYNLTIDDIQSYLDKSVSTSNEDQKSIGQKRPSVSKSSQQESAHEKDFVWELKGVDVVGLLQYIYASYNPTRTPNLEVLREKSDKEIMIILRQLCKRHHLSFVEMSSNIERYRETKTFDEENVIIDNTIDDGNEGTNWDAHSFQDEDYYANEADEVHSNVDYNHGDDSDAKPMAEVFRPPPPPPPKRQSSALVSGRRSSTQGRTSSTMDLETSKRVISTRNRPISSTGQQGVLMDEVLRQMNGRQQNSKTSAVKSDLPVDTFSSAVPPSIRMETVRTNNGVTKEEGSEDLSEICKRQHARIEELQTVVDSVLQENSRMAEEYRSKEKPLMISAGTQAIDETMQFNLENSQNQLRDAEGRFQTLKAEFDRVEGLYKKTVESVSKAKQSIDTLQKRCKILQHDRESILQFLNALCLCVPEAELLLSSYFVTIGEFVSLSTNTLEELRSQSTPASDRLDCLLRSTHQHGDGLKVDHRAVMKLSQQKCINSPSAVNKSISADEEIVDQEETDTDEIMKKQFDLTKKIIETKRSQAKLEGKLATANLLLLQTNIVNSSSVADIDTNMPSQRSEIQSRTSSPSINGRLDKNSARAAEPKNDQALDWVECVDPKSQRKYYYSPSLRKSTWTRPKTISSNSMDSQDDIEDIEKNKRRPLHARDASPTPSLQSIRSSTSVTSQQSSTASLFSQRSKQTRPSSAAASLVTDSSEWIAAIDPKTNRKYWFNRKTKISTWRKPAELIV